MNDFRTAVLKLAHEVPELRKHLMPILSKTAMEFDTEKALKKYLKEHPGADKSNHSVKKTEGGKSKGLDQSVKLKTDVAKLKGQRHWDKIQSSMWDFDETFDAYQGYFGDKKADKLLVEVNGKQDHEWSTGSSFDVDPHEEDPIKDIEDAIAKGANPAAVQRMIQEYPQKMQQLKDVNESYIKKMQDEMEQASAKGKRPKGDISTHRR